MKYGFPSTAAIWCFSIADFYTGLSELNAFGESFGLQNGLEFFCGGIAQMVVAVLVFIINDTISCVLFFIYGAFWLAVALINLFTMFTSAVVPNVC